jgi:hypothetical protein
MVTRKRRAVVTEETETVTVSRRRRQAVITEAVTDEHPVLYAAPGWQGMPQLTGAAYRAHREQQVRRCLEFLVIRAADPNERETVQCATNVLRAGPGASLGESIHGRYA